MRTVAAVLASVAILFTTVPADARTAFGPQADTIGASDVAFASVSGVIVSRASALPVTGAQVAARRPGADAVVTTTDGFGHYKLDLAPGVYRITISATGFEPLENDGVALTSGSAAEVDASLTLAATTHSTLATVAYVTANAHTLSASTTNTRVVSMSDLSSTGQIRIADQLGTLPAVNFSSSSSVGDDASINLRGLGSDETASLLDGHPVGPLGVGSGGFNFSLGPAFGLSEVDVTYGSGAQGLFGSDTIGGAVNFVTLSPTVKPVYTFQQQIGGFGLLGSAGSATGTFGKVGYALALARLGESGDFAPGVVAQSARPNNVDPSSVRPNGACAGGKDLASAPDAIDVSECNLHLNTYNVSQNTLQSVGVAKLDFAFSPVTHFKATAYTGIQWSDSTGNGDNDFLPYSTRLKQVQSGKSNCTTGTGAAGYQVVTDPIAGTTSCYTAQQFAAATSGPDGGGADRQRSTTMHDYDFSFSTRSGANSITAAVFRNNYIYWKDSSLAGGVSAAGGGLGTPTFADFYDTQGFLFADEIASAQNDLSFGYTVYHQHQDGNRNDFSGLSQDIPTSYFGEGSLFARDSYRFNSQLSLFANAWIKRSSVDDKTTFDPRATLLFRPASRDVVQFTYGHADGAPSPQLKLEGAAVAADPGASLTSVDCNGFNDVTSAGNPGLEAETADDFEFGYGHRFQADSNVQLNAYVTTVKNQLFSASEPLNQYGIGNVQFAPGAIATYLNRLQTQCPGMNITSANVANYLSVSTTYNAAHALVRGIEFSGRERFARIAYIDAGYYIESSTKTGISDQILASNETVVNGAQLAGIPLHEATVSVDVAPGPLEFRLDNYYVGYNNSYNRPAYWHSNAFVSYNFGHGSLVTLGGTNVFDNASQVYGLIGLGTAPITNSVAGIAPRAGEEFGLTPPQLTLTLQQKI